MAVFSRHSTASMSLHTQTLLRWSSLCFSHTCGSTPLHLTVNQHTPLYSFQLSVSCLPPLPPAPPRSPTHPPTSPTPPRMPTPPPPPQAQEDIEEEPAPRMFWPREIWGQYAHELEDFRQPANRGAAVQCLNHMVRCVCVGGGSTVCVGGGEGGCSSSRGCAVMLPGTG